MAGLSRADMEAVFLDSRQELERSVRRRLSSPDLAPDIVHDVYLRWTRVESVVPDRAEARAYLFRMVANLAIDHQKLEARRQEILEVEGRRQDTLSVAAPAGGAFAGSPESHALASDFARRVDAALQELPKRCRQALVLSRLHGMTHKEIAQQLGVSTSLVEKHVVRALLHLQDRLGSLERFD